MYSKGVEASNNYMNWKKKTEQPIRSNKSDDCQQTVIRDKDRWWRSLVMVVVNGDEETRLLHAINIYDKENHVK